MELEKEVAKLMSQFYDKTTLITHNELLLAARIIELVKKSCL
jgi:hypothetical protein